MPANIVVNIAGEDPNPGHGNISFRDALVMANSDNQADTITFAPGITAIQITDPTPLDVSDPGQANLTTIDGGGVVILQRDGTVTAGSVLNIDNGAFVELKGLTITGGYSTQSNGGGGLYVEDGSNATLQNVIVRGNTAGAGLGGGGGIFNGGVTRLIDSTVIDNTALGEGGGVKSVGQLVLENSTIADNSSAQSGGGIEALLQPGPPTSELIAFNSTISGNTVGGIAPPGGLANDASGGGIDADVATTLTNVTITNNRSVESAGGLNVQYAASATLNNTIVSGNFVGEGADATPDDVGGPGTIDPSSSHNLIGGNAMLGPLADNGGPTLTHALLSGSPAIDAGDNALAVDENGNPLTTDQRGFVRISGGAVDIGAYEFQALTATDSTGLVVVGSGPGGAPLVKVYNSQGGLVASFLAYDPAFTGGVSVALADVNGDGVPDIVMGAGPGGGPHVEVFDGTKLWMTQTDGEMSSAAVLASFYAYDAGFRGGVNVAAGDVSGGGKADIVTGAGPGGGPHVKVFGGAGFAVEASFYAYAPTFTGGVNVAVGDVTGPGAADVITGAGPGGGPHVEVFDGADLMQGGSVAASAVTDPLESFYAYAPGFTGGVSVAVGDVSAAGQADIITGAGPGGGPHVKAFDGTTLDQVASFFAYAPTFTGGVNVATATSTGGATADIVTGAGSTGVSQVEMFDAAGTFALASFMAFDPTFMGGVFVG